VDSHGPQFLALPVLRRKNLGELQKFRWRVE